MVVLFNSSGPHKNNSCLFFCGPYKFYDTFVIFVIKNRG